LQQTASIGIQLWSQVASPDELQDAEPPESKDVVGDESMIEVGFGLSSVKVPPPLPSHVSPSKQHPPETQYSPFGQ
jgi:hypothetical protein